MSVARKQSKAVLVIGIMYSDERVYNKSIKILEKKFGKIKLTTDIYNFNYSSYYREEMGEDIKKQILVLSNMIDRDYIINVKKITDKIEVRLLKDGKRLVNIDPGILTLENVILVTNKNFSHRIYLRKSVFADLTLVYKKHDGYSILPWTYADFRAKENIVFLNKVRELFFDKLKESSPFH